MSHVSYINTVIDCLSKRINTDNQAVIKLFPDDFSKGVGYISVHNLLLRDPETVVAFLNRAYVSLLKSQ